MSGTPSKRTRKRVETAVPATAEELAETVAESPNGTEPALPAPLIALRSPDGSDILRVDLDGTATFSEDADLDDLSRKFWQAVAGQRGVLASQRPNIVVFISGPMQGIPDFNRGQFNGTAALLERAGYQVLDPTTIESFSPVNPYDLNVRITLTALLHCNAVALLPGWQNSPASLREVEIANACGMTVAPLDYWLVEPN